MGEGRQSRDGNSFALIGEIKNELIGEIKNELIGDDGS